MQKKLNYHHVFHAIFIGNGIAPCPKEFYRPCALCLHLHRPLLKSARHCAHASCFAYILLRSNVKGHIIQRQLHIHLCKTRCVRTAPGRNVMFWCRRDVRGHIVYTNRCRPNSKEKISKEMFRRLPLVQTCWCCWQGHLQSVDEDVFDTLNGSLHTFTKWPSALMAARNAWVLQTAYQSEVTFLRMSLLYYYKSNRSNVTY